MTADAHGFPVEVPVDIARLAAVVSFFGSVSSIIPSAYFAVASVSLTSFASEKRRGPDQRTAPRRELSFLKTRRALGNRVAGDLSSRRESFVMVMQPAEFRELRLPCPR